MPSDSKNRGELTIEQEEELKKKIADTSWMIDKDKQQIQQTQDKVASYEYEFKKIQVCVRDYPRPSPPRNGVTHMRCTRWPRACHRTPRASAASMSWSTSS